MRQDPDICMVGEIRDLETADIAIQAALTGHLMLSTIHTNSASGAIPRFFIYGSKTIFTCTGIKCDNGATFSTSYLSKNVLWKMK